MFLPIIDEKIPLAFASSMDYGNFGDLLSCYVVEKLSGKEVTKYTYKPVAPHFSCIGSILSRNEISSPVLVWGSGFISQQNKYKIYLTIIRQILRGCYGKAEFLAVRGKKSREILLKAGFKCPEIYGDPALLMPLLYTSKNSVKKYRVGIVLHNIHENLPCFKKIKSRDTMLISINRYYENITDFIDEVLACEVILSSSLHGLIIGNAYNIPVARLIVKDYPIHPNKHEGEKRQNFKYDDYLTGFNSLSLDSNKPNYEFACLTLQKNEELSQEIIEKVYNMATCPDFEWSAEPLLKAFPYSAF